MPKSNQKKKQVITKENTKKPSIKRNSRGSKQYALASDIQKSQKDYEEQVAKESEDAGRRSLWTSVGGMLGAGAALMLTGGLAAPALAGLGALGTGIATGTAVGVGSLLGSGAGLASSKKGWMGMEKSRRDKIKVGKFFDKKAQEATDTFKDYDKKMQKSAYIQAGVSGLTAGLQAGGAFKKAGEWAKKGLNINKTGSVDMSIANKAVAEVPMHPSDAKILSHSTANPMGQPIQQNLAQKVGGTLIDKTLALGAGAAANKFTGKSNQNNIQFEQEEIGLPDYGDMF
jgi:hypothetical protein